MSLDNLSTLGYGYGCEDSASGGGYLSHLCYRARQHHPMRQHGREPGCSSIPAGPCPKMHELLQRPSCHGCDDYAKPTDPPVNPRDYYAHQTALMTGGSKAYGYAAAKACTACTAPVSAAAKDVMAHERRSKPIVVEGRLVDMRCYSMDLRNYGQDHVAADGKVLKGCATACAKSGIPVGVLTGNGAPGNQVYVLLTASPQLAGHMNKMVRVAGQLMSDSGCILTEKIEFKNADTKQFEEATVITPM